jgi:Holliday junction resolvase RusA-like endonuclease
MTPIRFFVPGSAVGKQRPRVVQRGRFARAYTPEETVNYEALVRVAAHKAMEGRPLLDVPLDLTIIIQVAVPQSWSNKRKAEALSGLIRPTTKPDWDNVSKAICDAMEGVVYVNDSRVVEARVQKFYDKAPGVFVALTTAEGARASQ